MSPTANVLPNTLNGVESDDISNILAGNTVGIDPSEVVIELETLSPEERQHILMETANSTDTDSVREAIQEALELIENTQKETHPDVVHISSDLVQRVKTARDNNFHTTDMAEPSSTKTLK